MYSEFFDDKPVSWLIGEGIDASHINDDALDRWYVMQAFPVYTSKLPKRSLTTSNSPANSPI
jgi:hypothetical protein